jgi:hypothetical protein
VAYGGSEQENIASIKFNAPRVNAAKNRAVTATDYEALILANYAGAESVSVWGGEDNDPPYYGRVIISLKPFSSFTISDATKESIKNNIYSQIYLYYFSLLFSIVSRKISYTIIYPSKYGFKYIEFILLIFSFSSIYNCILFCIIFVV